MASAFKNKLFYNSLSLLLSHILLSHDDAITRETKDREAISLFEDYVVYFSEESFW